MRMCAVMRQVRPIDELIRFVVSPQGEVVPDLKRKLPGRGLWVSASHQAVAEAVRRNQFSKGFKRDLRVATYLYLTLSQPIAGGDKTVVEVTDGSGSFIKPPGKL